MTIFFIGREFHIIDHSHKKWTRPARPETECEREKVKNTKKFMIIIHKCHIYNTDKIKLQPKKHVNHILLSLSLVVVVCPTKKLHQEKGHREYIRSNKHIQWTQTQRPYIMEGTCPPFNNNNQKKGQMMGTYNTETHTQRENK